MDNRSTEQWEADFNSGKLKELQFIKEFCDPGQKYHLIDDVLKSLCKTKIEFNRHGANIGTIFGDVAIEFNGILVLFDVKQNWIAKKSIEGFKNNMTYYAIYLSKPKRTIILRRDIVILQKLVYNTMPSSKNPGLSPEFISKEFADAPTFEEGHKTLKILRRQRISDLTLNKLKSQIMIAMAGQKKKVDSNDLLLSLDEFK